MLYNEGNLENILMSEHTKFNLEKIASVIKGKVIPGLN
jgi:hypothetical protein